MSAVPAESNQEWMRMLKARLDAAATQRLVERRMSSASTAKSFRSESSYSSPPHSPLRCSDSSSSFSSPAPSPLVHRRPESVESSPVRLFQIAPDHQHTITELQTSIKSRLPDLALRNDFEAASPNLGPTDRVCPHSTHLSGTAALVRKLAVAEDFGGLLELVKDPRRAAEEEDVFDVCLFRRHSKDCPSLRLRTAPCTCPCYSLEAKLAECAVVDSSATLALMRITKDRHRFHKQRHITTQTQHNFISPFAVASTLTSLQCLSNSCCFRINDLDLDGHSPVDLAFQAGNIKLLRHLVANGGVANVETIESPLFVEALEKAAFEDGGFPMLRQSVLSIAQPLPKDLEDRVVAELRMARQHITKADINGTVTNFDV